MFQVCDQSENKLFLEMDGKTENIPFLIETCEEFAKKYLNEEDAYSFAVAIDEAVTNIILYACKNKPMSKIILKLFKEDDEVCIQIENFSEMFIPPVIIEKKKISYEKLEEGGLGLFLMQEFMDELRFYYDENENKNIIIMKKYLNY